MAIGITWRAKHLYLIEDKHLRRDKKQRGIAVAKELPVPKRNRKPEHHTNQQTKRIEPNPMTAIVPIALPVENKKVQARKSSAIRRRIGRLHDDAANGMPEAICAILLASCLITALGQCLTQIVA